MRGGEREVGEEGEGRWWRRRGREVVEQDERGGVRRSRPDEKRTWL